MGTKRLDLTLTLFFTGGVSLESWINLGFLHREIELYKRLSDRIKRVNFVTYGGKKDGILSPALEPIHHFPTRWHKDTKFTIGNLMLKHLRGIRETDILKTNQLLGFEIPLWIKKKMGKKLILRCGYLHSYFMKQQSKEASLIKLAMEQEGNAFMNADMGIVTSEWQKDYIVGLYGLDSGKVRVIPNYVLTDIFKPNPLINKTYDLVYLGRSNGQKNLSGLLKALQRLQARKKRYSLLMIGGCNEDQSIRDFVRKEKLDVFFERNAPHLDLPDMLNKAKVFILPSHYEGHPKALLEAMSCGLPCIGTNVTGIKEEIQHLKNGFISEKDHESIAVAIETVLSDLPLQQSMGKNARTYIQENYAINKIEEMEFSILQKVKAR